MSNKRMNLTKRSFTSLAWQGPRQPASPVALRRLFARRWADMARMSMRGAWITDITHYLDSAGRVPARPRPIVVFMGSIVVESSKRAAGDTHAIDVKCRRRPGRRPCRGMIHSSVDPGTREIQWHCPVCDDHGLISNWEGSPWDVRSVGHSLSRESLWTTGPQFTSAAKHVWDSVSPKQRLRILNNVWCVTCADSASIILERASMNGGDLVLRGSCSECGGEVARLVECSGAP